MTTFLIAKLDLLSYLVDTHGLDKFHKNLRKSHYRRTDRQLENISSSATEKNLKVFPYQSCMQGSKGIRQWPIN